MNLILPITILCCFLISITTLYLVNEWYLSKYDREKTWNPIFQKDFNTNGKKIYVLGNSRINVLNYTIIKNHFVENGIDDIKIYRLGSPGTRPLDRLPILDTIISTKPEMVAIGLTFWDLDVNVNDSDNIQIITKPENTIGDPEEIFRQILPSGKFFGLDLYNIKNPKLSTLETFNILIDNFTGKKNNTSTKMNPEYPLNKIINRTEIQRIIDNQNVKEHIPVNNNPQVTALKEIIKELIRNNIKVVIFSTPRHPLYTDTIQDFEKENFRKILENIHKEFDVNYYSLDEKYSHLEIWADYHHVTTNPSGYIFSEDVAEILLREWKS
jgi:hypothetical protein